MGGFESASDPNARASARGAGPDAPAAPAASATHPAQGVTALRASLILWGAFAAAKLAIHLWVGTGYGWFRDEFYYVACSDHLAWGYVDQPPLSIALLKGWRVLFGDSLTAIRVLPALAGAAAVFLTGWIARAMGASRFGQALAMTAVVVAPLYLGVGQLYSMNVFELLFWTMGTALVTGILGGRGLRWWIALGVVIGLGLLNKWSVLWFAGGIGLGMLLTPHRRLLKTRGPWIATAIAALLFLPNILWQIAHGWPTLEFMHNATSAKMRAVAPLEFFSGQILSMHPLTLPIWLAGLVFLLVKRALRPLAIAWLAVCALLVFNGTSRSSYLAPAYVMLFAAGGVALERTLLPARWPLLRGLAFGVLVAGGAVLAPLSLPILPIDTYVAYAAKLRIGPSTEERKTVARLPQHFADMQGWDAMVAELARVYDALPAADRATATIFANNYGEAGAIDVLGRAHGLPFATSGHNNYWLWGPRGSSGQVLILMGGAPEDHARLFERVERAGEIECGDCMPYENHQPVYVVRGLKQPLTEVWPRVKHFD